MKTDYTKAISIRVEMRKISDEINILLNNLDFIKEQSVVDMVIKEIIIKEKQYSELYGEIKAICNGES